MAAAVTFAQPKFDWDEVNGPQERFDRPYAQGHQGRGMEQRQWAPQQDREGRFGGQGFNGGGFDRPQRGQFPQHPRLRAAMMAKAYRQHRGGRNMMQGNAPYAFRGQGRFNQGGGMGMEGRAFAYPNRENFNRNQMEAPYAFKGHGQFDQMKKEGMRGMDGQRFAYPDAKAFKKGHKGKNFDGQKQDRFEGGQKQFRGEGNCPNDQMDDDDRGPQGRCPRDEMNAPKGHKGEMKQPKPENAEKAKPAPDANPEVTKLKLELRNAMINKDYDQAEKVIKSLKKIDK